MKKYALSASLGTIMTLLGFLIGLQISPILANVILFPIIIASKVTNTGFGEMNPFFLGALFLITIFIWSAIAYSLISHFATSKRN